MVQSVTDVLSELGGVASRATLVSRTSRGAVERALASGDLVRLGRSRLAHAQLDAGRVLAGRLGGVVAATDAAHLHGWEVAHRSSRPHVIVPRGRSVPPKTRAHVHRVDLAPEDHECLATVPEVTLRHSMRWLPFPDALAIADSALRGGIDRHVLQAIAVDAVGPGSPQVRRVAREATHLAESAFESALRAICLDVPGLCVRPQVWVNGHTRSDLVDERLRIVVEAESFRWHGQLAELTRDARRYNLLVVDGWFVLRFAYADVMDDPASVREVLLAAVAAAQMSTQRRPQSLRRSTVST